jgi:plastocyanin
MVMAQARTAVAAIAWAAIVGLTAAACSTRNQSVSAPLFQAEPEPPPAPVSEHPATITGQAPAARDEVPAVVVLQSRTPLTFPRQKVQPMMDQVARRFTPGVLVVRTGQPANFRNDDDVIHNVRVRERNGELDEPAFNIALPQGGSYLYSFKKDAVYDVKCDMHQNMSGVVVSSSSPYSAVAGQDGSFTIDNVPPGSYTVMLYTADGTTERPLEVAEDQRIELNLDPAAAVRAARPPRPAAGRVGRDKRPAKS